MKIAKIEPYILSHKLEKSFSFSQWEYSERRICIVKITTDEGIVGWGEGYGPAEIIHSGIEFFSKFILGKSILDTEGAWMEMYRRSLDYARRGVMVAAMSAIDIALWDCKGKFLNLPISVLLGGRKREHVRVYATGMYFVETDDLLQYLAEEARGYKEAGFDAMKMKVGMNVSEDIRMVKAVRDAIGNEIELMVDANHAYSLNESLRLSRSIEKYDISWFEEPISPDQYDKYRELRTKSNIPISAGECEYLRAGFYQLFKNECVDIAQPDICAAGGITEVKKIASMAQTFGIDFIPHTWGTGIAMSAALQLLANLDIPPGRLKEPEAFMELDRTENPLRDKLIFPAIMPENGKMKIPNSPGLGIDVDESLVAYYSINKKKKKDGLRI